MKRPIVALAAGSAALLLTPAAAFAAKAPNHPAPATCSVSGNSVNASGLPTDEVINFMVTDASGTHGWVLGMTPDGTWSVTVGSPSSPTTYQFVSRTWGPGGSKFTVFAACS